MSSGRVTYGDSELRRIDRLVGKVQLRLPTGLRRELDGVFAPYFSGTMPAAAIPDRLDLIAAACALMLKGTEFGGVMEREAEKDRELRKWEAEKRDLIRLDQLRQRHARAFEATMMDRRLSAKKIDAAHAAFIDDIELLPDHEHRPLKAWADELFRKRKSLRGRAA